MAEVSPASLSDLSWHEHGEGDGGCYTHAWTLPNAAWALDAVHDRALAFGAADRPPTSSQSQPKRGELPFVLRLTGGQAQVLFVTGRLTRVRAMTHRRPWSRPT